MSPLTEKFIRARCAGRSGRLVSEERLKARNFCIVSSTDQSVFSLIIPDLALLLEIALKNCVTDSAAQSIDQKSLTQDFP